MSKPSKLDYEENVPYIVYMKKDSVLCGIRSEHFCGYLVNNVNGSFYFELNGSRMIVVVPHEDIRYMYPSTTHLKIFLSKKEKEKDESIERPSPAPKG